MSIDNVLCNGKRLGALIKGDHGVTNMLDQYGKQRGLSSAHYLEGHRDAAYPIIDLVLAYIGNHGNITPIKLLEFDVVDEAGATSQHVIMRDCVVTSWSLNSHAQPLDPAAPARPDVEQFRIEAVDVEIQAGGAVQAYKRIDPNQAN